MPQNPEDQLHVRGQEYFVKMEITSSAKQKEIKEKVSNVRLLQRYILPKLDAMADELSRQPDKKIVVRYQHDNASPHVEKHSNSIWNNNSHNGGG